MPFDLTVNKQMKGSNGDPGPLTSNNYVMVGGDNSGGYFLRGGQAYDSTGVLIEGELPEAVFKALKNMSNESRASVGFEMGPELEARAPKGVGVDFTGGLKATPMQLNTKRGGEEKAEPVPQGEPVLGEDGIPLPVRKGDLAARVADYVDGSETAATNEAHQAKIDAARKRGSKIDPSLLNK